MEEGGIRRGVETYRSLGSMIGTRIREGKPSLRLVQSINCFGAAVGFHMLHCDMLSARKRLGKLMDTCYLVSGPQLASYRGLELSNRTRAIYSYRTSSIGNLASHAHRYVLSHTGGLGKAPWDHSFHEAHYLSLAGSLHYQRPRRALELAKGWFCTRAICG